MLNKFRPFPWGLGGAAAQLLPPTITMGSPTPGTGTPGTSVSMPGTGFGSTPGTVTLHGVTATVTGWTPTHITFTVPAQLSYPDTSAVVVVTADGRIDTGPTFTTTSPYTAYAASFSTGNPLLLNTANKVALLPPGSFSCAAWVKLGVGNNGAVMGVAQSAQTTWVLDVDSITGKPRMQAVNNSGPAASVATGGAAINGDGAWHLLVGTFNAVTFKASISVDNGAFVDGSAALTAVSGANNGFAVGNRNDQSLAFGGAIDAPALWLGRVLTTSDVALLWNTGAGLKYADLTGGNAGLLTSLTGWWDLQEATGATRADATANAYNLTDPGANVVQVAGKT